MRRPSSRRALLLRRTRPRLALEEVGKAIICCGGFAGSENTVTTRERFCNEIGEPLSKLTWASNFVDVMVSMARLGLGITPVWLHRLRSIWTRYRHSGARQRPEDVGFYVDLSDINEVQLPAEITVPEGKR